MAGASSCRVTLRTFFLIGLLLLPAIASAQQGLTDSLAPEHPDTPGPATRAASPGVGSSGAFVHDIPLALPAGRRNMAPELSLHYSSQATSGIVGLGWQLSGLPAIVRINAGTGIQYASSDSFAFVGSWLDRPQIEQRLVRINATQFHLARDSRQRFEPAGTCGIGQPCTWKMRDGNGRTYYFGNVAQLTRVSGSAQISAASLGRAGTSAIAAWGLSRVEDDYGNAYEIGYLDEPGHLYPSRIVWTLPSASVEPDSPPPGRHGLPAVTRCTGRSGDREKTRAVDPRVHRGPRAPAMGSCVRAQRRVGPELAPEHPGDR